MRISLFLPKTRYNAVIVMNFQIDRLLAFLNEITAIYSPTNNEQTCADFLVQKFSIYNPIIDQNGNVFFKVSGEGKPLLLCAHMDVVEPCTKSEMIVENGMVKNKHPFVLGIDNKAAIACFYELVQVIEDGVNAGGAKRRPLEVLFTVQEETTNNGARFFDYNLITAHEGIIIDSALPFGSVITKSPYYTTFDISVSGPTHHTKELHTNEETAWKALSTLISTLPHGSVSDETNINWSTITGGTGRNTVTGEFTIQGEVRSFNKNEFDEITKKINEITHATPHAKIITQNAVYNNGYIIHETDTWLQTVKNALRQTTGATPQSVTSYGLSDANEIRPFNINVLNISSGAQHTHTQNETISVQDLENAVKTLLLLSQNK